MRVLVLLTAIVASVAAAPSVLAPVAHLAIPAVAVPAAIPTISPGDLQAAAINAKVQAEDYARALEDQARLAADQAQLAADQARDSAEQAPESQTEKAIELNDEIQAKAQENFWAGEDKKWQAVDAVQTAEAQLDGAIASNAANIAKSAFSGVLIPSPVIPGVPVISPYSQLVYTPGIVAPSPQVKSDIKPEDPALALKAAEKPEELEKPVEPAQPESEALPKPEESLKSLAPVNFIPIGVSPVGPVLKYADPLLTFTPIAYIHPGQPFAAAPIPQIHGQYLTPAIVSA